MCHMGVTPDICHPTAVTKVQKALLPCRTLQMHPKDLQCHAQYNVHHINGTSRRLRGGR